MDAVQVLQLVGMGLFPTCASVVTINPRCLATTSIRQPGQKITSWAQVMVASNGTCAWHQVNQTHGLQAHVPKTTHCKYPPILLPGSVYDLAARPLIRRCLGQGDMASNMTSEKQIENLCFEFVDNLQMGPGGVAEDYQMRRSNCFSQFKWGGGIIIPF